MKNTEVKKLDKRWREIIKNLADNRCEVSRRRDCQLHCHHYIGRRNRSTRWYLPNGVLLSASLHKLSTKSAHENPEWFRKEMIKLRGQDWLDNLYKQSDKAFKGTYQQVLDYLEGKTNNYC